MVCPRDSHRAVLLVVVVAIIAFSAGLFVQRYHSSVVRRWQLLPRRHEGALGSDHGASPAADASGQPADSGDATWCWVKRSCNDPAVSDSTFPAKDVPSQPGFAQQTAQQANPQPVQGTMAAAPQSAQNVTSAQLQQAVIPQASPQRNQNSFPEAGESMQQATLPELKPAQPEQPAHAQAPYAEKGRERGGAAQQTATLDVVGLAVKPTCINRAAVAGMLTHVRPRALHVVTSTARQCVAFRSWGDVVNCHPQDALVPGLTKDGMRRSLVARFGVDAGRSHMTSWYLQQFLKVGVAGALPGLSDYYLIWDMDMVPLRPLPLLTRVNEAAEAGPTGGARFQTLVNIGGNATYVADYEVIYKALFGRKMELAPDGSSLVTHMMVAYKPFMEQHLAEIANTTAPAPPLAWIASILDTLPKDNSVGAFSEYATYLSWVRQRYPGSQQLADRVTWRRCGPGGQSAIKAAANDAPDGLCCPTAAQIQAAEQQGLDYCGWDVGHVPVCKYHNAAYTEAYGVELPP